MKIINCINCGRAFECGHPGSCWCTELPPIMPLDNTEGCLCRTCLLDQQNKKIKQLIESTPLSELTSLTKQYQTDEFIEGLDYVVQKGKWIFSKWYHLKRGFCCYKGCVNCPY